MFRVISQALTTKEDISVRRHWTFQCAALLTFTLKSMAAGLATGPVIEPFSEPNQLVSRFTLRVEGPDGQQLSPLPLR